MLLDIKRLGGYSIVEKRPTVAIVDRSAIRHNFKKIREKILPDTKILAVVKADAYGHGAVEVARVLESIGCDFFGVALCEEGIELRKAGIKTPIVVLGGSYPGQPKELLLYNLTPVVFDTDTALLLNKHAKKSRAVIKIHVKVDTGMGRLGFLPHQIGPFLKKLKGLENIELEGILSHFAEVDEENKSYSKKQLDCFLDVLDVVKKMNYKPKFAHMANSAAIVDYPSAHFNLVRPGIMLYGSYPNNRFKDKIDLRAAMKLKTQVIQLKRVSSGFPVSYGRRYVTDKDTIIATIPIGYGDGYPRCLSESGDMLVRGKRARVIGMVCMDLTMLDVSDIDGVNVGDEVVVMGSQNEEEITADDIAERAGMISYEVLCGISKRVPRVYI
ncbi:MAG: alanine racemase [Thermodesulfobacteriota bacterium]